MSSQLQVSGEAKIRDIQGPVVANSGVITALDGATSQYVRGDGTLADFPTSTGGGSSVSYYLNSSVSQGTIGGVAYRELSKDPIIGAGTDIAISSNGYVANYITDVNDPDVTIVPGGNFNCEFYFSVNNNTRNPNFYAELYKYDGTTFTLLGTSAGVPEYINQGTTIAPYYFAIPVATAALSVTDRLAIRIYVDVDSRTVTLHTENGHLCQVVTTLSKGMVSLNNLTDQSQFITTGTAGTNFAIVSSGDTHTFNLPIASATNTGKLSSTDWSTFNNKQAAGNYVTLDTTQTITGAKTFSTGLKLDLGLFLKESSSSGRLSGYVGISATATGGLQQLQFLYPVSGSSIFTLPTTGSYNYEFPSLSGTIALTSDISYPVSSVFGRTGAVIAVSGDYNTSQVTENTNLYFTDARSRLALSFAAGSGAYNSTTGVITIPTNNNQITNGSNFITLGSLSAGTGISYNNTTGVITNSAPDQTVSLSNGAGISVSGTYPSFTIASTITQYTDALARAALSFAAGSGAYNSTTGVITIPTNNNQITNGSNYITLASLSAGAGITYNNTTGVIASSITQYTDALARAAISLTTTGTSGAATYNSTTGVLNVPQYTDQYVGTVTSVGLSAPTGFSVTNSPVTTSGTLTLSFASGYSLPTTIKQSNWDDAYTFVTAFPTQTGNAGKYLTTNGSALSWADNPLGTVTSVGLSSATSGVTIGSSPITSSGTITLAIATASGSQNGLLSSTDWTTFNNKQSALTNPVTGTGTTNYLPKFTGASTIGNSVIQEASGFIGIGVSPSRKLHVLGGAGTSQIQSTGTSSIMYFGDASSSSIDNQGFGSIGNSLYLLAGGVERLYLTSTGNLGLGVTPSAWGSAFKAIQVGGVGSIMSSDNTYFISSNSYINSSSIRTYITNGYALEQRMSASDGEYQWKIAASGTAGNAITFTQAMTLTAAGRLLINKTNEETYQLDVNGTGRFSGAVTIGASSLITGSDRILELRGPGSNNSALLRYSDGATAKYSVGFNNNEYIIFDDVAGVRRLQIASTGAATFSNQVIINGPSSNWAAVIQNTNSSSGTSYGLKVQAGTSSAVDATFVLQDYAGNEFFTARGNQRIGIGTNSPSGLLHLSNTNPQLFITNTQGGSSYYMTVSPTTGFNIYENGVASWFTIRNGGNVLIGTTDDSGQKLQINGITKTAGLSLSGTTVSTTQTITSSFYMWIFNGASGQTLTLYSSSGHNNTHFIKNSSANSLTLAATNIETLTSTTTVGSITIPAYKTVQVISNGGAVWLVMNQS